MDAIEAVCLAEESLGENLTWLTNQLNLQVRQKDPETLRRLKQLNDTWVILAKCKAEGMEEM